MNLDFEDATISPTPIGQWTYPADPTQCFPGWTVGGSETVVSYNSLSSSAPAVVLMGPDFPNFPYYAPLEGSYSVLLQYFSSAQSPSLSQTGLIPAGTKSINFLVGSNKSDAAVTLNGVNIPMVPISGGRLAGDVSAFAGRVVQLTISSPGGTGPTSDWLYFDDVQFSPSMIPEPNTNILFTMFILSFCWWVKRSNTARGRVKTPAE